VLTTLRRGLALLLRPLFRALARAFPVKDPWERHDVQPRLTMYGSGARFDFDHYLRGASIVTVSSVQELQDWLLACRYESDEKLFSEPDFWQHPATFEQLRAGDCEDFALWAWRKLIELGVDADFVTGYCLRDGQLDGRHAWVLYREGGVEFLLEPVCRTPEKMIQPLSQVRDSYLPQFGTDRRGKRFSFSGYLVSDQLR
jgi:hypothetical protein